MNQQTLIQEKQIQYTLDTDADILVDMHAFLTILLKDGSKLLDKNPTEFNKRVDFHKEISYKAFQKNTEHEIKRLNQMAAKIGTMVVSKDGKMPNAQESISEMAYQKPNFEKVWGQVSNNAFVSSLGLDRWIELAQSGKGSKISKPTMDNVLDYDPNIKAPDNLGHSHVSMPIIIKTPMGDYHLLNGNDTINGLMDMHGNAKVWYIDATQADV